MSELEYILQQYLGPPNLVRGGGVSYWSCPLCEHYSFHTLPIKEQFKHRFKCWNPECEFRGDAADLLKEFHPDEPWDERLRRLQVLRDRWEEEHGQTKTGSRRKRGLVRGRGASASRRKSRRSKK